MTRTIRRTLAGLGAAALLTGAAAATAQGGANESAKGAVSSPGVNIEFDAKNDANGNPSGTFVGTLKVGLQIMRAEGPVTCLEVEGNKVGFFYPMKTVTPSIVKVAKLGVYMNLTTDGKGNAKSISYSVVPFKKQGGCKPAPTFIPASGKVALKG